MNASKAWVSVCVLITLMAGTVSAVNIETVPVGNPGNAPDTRYATPGYGSVGYIYNIGKYEVTAGQYCEFLNAVAKTDAYGLYNTEMADPSHRGCNILRSGQPGNYTYSVAPDWTNRPVNYVGWGDAARFANWMHNGQPTGSLTGNPTQDAWLTENGSYTLNGATDNATLIGVMRKSDATWVIPTEDEWYKAAYHKNDGTTADYWDYPTSSDAMPSNEVIDPDPGNNATTLT